jgi:uncharacterized membrane protein YedE/YeeE
LLPARRRRRGGQRTEPLLEVSWPFVTLLVGIAMVAAGMGLADGCVTP